MSLALDCVVVPVDKFSVVITMVMAFFILGEAITTKTIIGGLLITAGTLVLIFLSLIKTPANLLAFFFYVVLTS